MIRAGDRVVWTWGKHEAEGRVVECHSRRVERTLKGTHVVRIGTSDNPAVVIRQDDGDEVLKLASELRRA